MFPERTKLSLALAVALVVLALGTTAYSIAMTVNRFGATFVVDASASLIPGVSFFLSAAVTVMRALAWRLLETKKKGAPGFSEMRRNAVIFFAGSAMLTACFLVWFIAAVLELLTQ